MLGTKINKLVSVLLLGMTPLFANAADLTADFNYYAAANEGDMDIAWMADRFTESDGYIPIPANQVAHFDYVEGPGRICSTRRWHVRVNGGSWQEYKTELLKLNYPPNTKIEMYLENDGWTNFFNCWRHNQVAYSPRYKFKFTGGMADTKHPVVTVGGVLGYGDILTMDYFYGLEDAIIANSNHDSIIKASVGAWVDTEERGARLAQQIIANVFERDLDNAFSDEPWAPRVNVVAHSHGGTTARVALHLIADLMNEMGYEGNPVASLTTVGTPHYGNPLAEGLMHVVQEWPTREEGGAPIELVKGLPKFNLSARDFIFDFVAQGALGNAGGGIVDVFSGEITIQEWLAGTSPSSGEDLVEVLSDFTQRGMANFNACYPSVGLANAGVEYYFSEGEYTKTNPYTGKPYSYQHINAENGQFTRECENWRTTKHTLESDANFSGNRGEERLYSVYVGPNEDVLVVKLSGGSGDADLYLQKGSQATQSSYDCRPYLVGNDEHCVVEAPAMGWYHIMVRAYSDYANASLTANTGYKFALTNTASTDQSDITLTGDLNRAYGGSQVNSSRGLAGDGLGNVMNPNDPKAVQYFSFTGTSEQVFNWASNGYINFPDLIDVGLMLINGTFAFADGRFGEDEFYNWWHNNIWRTNIHFEYEDRYGNLIDPPYDVEETDTFVPEPSARFGDYSGYVPGWNHMDEVNGFAGWVDPLSADPKTVYLMHLNKLKNMGL